MDYLPTIALVLLVILIFGVGDRVFKDYTCPACGSWGLRSVKREVNQVFGIPVWWKTLDKWFMCYRCRHEWTTGRWQR